MDIFKYAMKMELDGKKYYEEHAARVEIPELRRILLELASDEQKHYNIFKAMHDGLSVEREDTTQTNVLNEVKNVFEILKTQNKDFSFSSDVKDIWVKAREIEKKSETFYRQKIDEIHNEKQRDILSRIAAEEHKHWVAVDNVICFLDRPSQWLEDAEWGNPED